MTGAVCPLCGAPASGNFCSSCGAALGNAPCPTCGATPETGARFCNKCGGALGHAASAGGVADPAPASTVPPVDTSRLGWWLAGATMVALMVVVAYPILRSSGSEGGPAVGAPGGGDGSPPDLSTMTPREAADRLFERVMIADAQGNDAEVGRFLPMAVSAYDIARPLDLDGLFHLSLLLSTGGDYASALAVAQEGLEEHPDHLLNLAAAAEAALAAGDEVMGRAYYGRFLELYEGELAGGPPEYSDHMQFLPGRRETAEELLSR